MSNNVENCTAEEFIKLCFADDITNPYNRSFWENFDNLNVDDIKSNQMCIYYYTKYPNEKSLPDPDSCSERLYESHRNLWNKQSQKFNERLKPNIPQVIKKKKNTWELHGIDNDNFRLSSDSIMSIYWHRTSGDMPDIMKIICKDVDKLQAAINKLKLLLNFKEEDIRSYNDMCNNKHYSLYKEFIWYYLQYANTIGGFILFPRHANSINQRRGRKPFDDRFDLALEYIRRAFLGKSFSSYNPLFDISAEDKEFFKMFGDGKEGFKNYIDFFLLNSWVKEDEEHHYYHVKNLLHTGENEDKERNIQLLDNWDFNQKPLPQDENEWWIFYRNIMDRLEARNKQIEELLREKCSEGELQELYNSLYLNKH